MSSVVDTAIRAKLLAAPGLAPLVPGGVHNGVKPQGADTPAIVFAMVGSTEMQSYSDDGVEALRYDVKVIAPQDRQKDVGTALRLVRAALNRVPLTLAQGEHLQTLSTARVPQYAETAGIVTYVHKGWQFTVWVANVG